MDEEIEARLQAKEERRQHDRSRLIIDVFFNGQDATGVASTTDISVGGLFMTTQMEIPEGSVLLVRIPLSGNEQVVVNAEVVYTEPGRGVGLSFQGLSAEDRALLERELNRR
ncbi:MAG TPA: PilZ domain-containing protein [Pyrinomonadaceae bacterium]|nr:PilZ domain-containing protein [Pyrinomonadaceae bacterium]